MATLRLKAHWQRNNFCLTVDTHLPTQGITALFGRSGCGKSSLLRLIAGLDRVPAATVMFNQQCWQHQQRFIPLHQRNIGLVFQHPGLLPHLSAQQNLLYGFSRVPAKQRRWLPPTVIEMLELNPLLSQPISSLSGGQQQRLALGRALLSNPQLLLLDEPFAALDSQSKSAILPFIRTLVDETGIPMIFVSHDSREVEKLADQLVLLEAGAIKQQQGIKTALADPNSPLFDGSDITSLWVGKSGRKDDWGRIPVSNQDCCIWVSDAAGLTPAPAAETRLSIRAKDVSIALAVMSDLSIQNQLPARIINLLPYRQQVLVQLQLSDGQLLQAEITPYAATQLNLAIGMTVIALMKAIAIR